MRQENSYSELISDQRRFFNSNVTLSYDFRIAQLKKLLSLVEQYEDRILDALNKDLHKSKFEAWGVEVGIIQIELKYAIAKLSKWMKPEKLRTPLFHFYSKSFIQKIPYGVTLTIAPWNYPFMLALRPVVGALAAGNTCVIKPSELAENTAVLLEEIINNNFPKDFLHVVNTGAEGTGELVKNQFDFIFFTGGTKTGKIIYEAAARNLTPVALELGGKNPCIIDSNTNLEITADRISWGKFSNAGQTCVAPDYLLVQRDIKDKLIEKITVNLKKYFGADIISSDDYGRIISEKHFDRITELLKGEKIIYGGEADRSKKYISPTIVEIDSLDSPIMHEEIFGPILPIISYNLIEEALSVINRNPEPLVIYLFTHDRNLTKKIIRETSSGDLVINEVVLHFGHLKLPIGGKGNSGIGKYQGKFSFDEFSHKKSVMKRSFFPDLSVRYPPYNDKKLRFLKKMFRWFMWR